MPNNSQATTSSSLSNISIMLGIVGMLVGSAFGASTYIDSRVAHMLQEHSKYPHRGVSASMETVEALKERIEYLEKIVHRLEFEDDEQQLKKRQVTNKGR